ncbi:MAG: isochorismatase family protein [Deltaproteobacteria bacterium]|nr:isochorismatase family protein [Deltaproteobacteria bacterium]
MAIPKIASYDLPPVGSWPVARAPWSLDPSRAALLIHDMQTYFLRAYDPSTAPLRPAIEGIRTIREACRAAGVPVLFSAQPGEQSRDERGLLWDMWGPGIVEHPELQRVVEGLEPSEGDIMLPKRRYSAFHGTDLRERLIEMGRDQLIISGVYAHIGCLTTAVDGFMQGVKPFLVADAVADFSRADHEVALRQVARTCGVVTTVAEVVAAVSVP